MSLFGLLIFVFMLMPASVAVFFAARAPLFIVWNFAWFWVLAKVGVWAFGAYQGAYPALFFVLLYTYRAMTKPQRSRPQMMGGFSGAQPQEIFELLKRMQGVRSPGGHASPGSARHSAAAQDDVIDAEFVKADDTPPSPRKLLGTNRSPNE